MRVASAIELSAAKVRFLACIARLNTAGELLLAPKCSVYFGHDACGAQYIVF